MFISMLFPVAFSAESASENELQIRAQSNQNPPFSEVPEKKTITIPPKSVPAQISPPSKKLT